MLARHYTTGGYAAAIFPLGEYGPFKRRFLLAAAHGWSTASQLPSAVPSSVSLGAVWVWLADGFTVATSRLWYECNPVPWPTDQLTIHYGAQQHYWPHWPRRREMHVIQICLILCSWNFQGRLTVYSVVWCFKESGNSFENILKSGVTSRGVGFHKSALFSCQNTLLISRTSPLPADEEGGSSHLLQSEISRNCSEVDFCPRTWKQCVLLRRSCFFLSVQAYLILRWCSHRGSVSAEKSRI